MSPAFFRILLPAAVVGSLAFGAFACSSSSSRNAFGTDSPDGGPGTGSGTGFSPTTDAGGANEDGCSDEAKLVYVLSIEGDLYSFAPADKKFTKVGPLDCASGNEDLVPISMAVDRDAVAWVNLRGTLSGGLSELYKVDTKTAKCTKSGITGLIGGMGFSTDANDSKSETLFVIGEGQNVGNPGLSRVDFAKKQIVKVHDFDDFVDLELTGTGDGRLYGFLTGNPLVVAQVDKTTSAVSDNVPLTNVDKPLGVMYAFSFWGGDFYVYTATSETPAKTSTVSRYRPSDGSIDNKYMTQIGFHIVGAGVSTCAPVSSPK